MLIVNHRCNTLKQLSDTHRSMGVEVDVRTERGRLILSHDAFTQGQDFEGWLDFFQHEFLIVNVKEDGLEDSIISLLSSRGIFKFFFLDQPTPTLVKMASKGEKRCAIRVSEFEPIEMALHFEGKLDWIWIDCFTRFPLDGSSVLELADSGFKICLVSPELQGRTEPEALQAFFDQLEVAGVNPDAVCTKDVAAWTRWGASKC